MNIYVYVSDSRYYKRDYFWSTTLYPDKELLLKANIPKDWDAIRIVNYIALLLGE